MIEREQVRVLEALRDHDRVAVMSGRGVGKTATAAMATHWWLCTRQPSLVVCSAGSWSHLTDKLWPEVLAWGGKNRLRELFEFQERGIYSNSRPRTWRAETSSSDDPNKVEGFHSPNMLLIIDEAKSMPDEIYTALIASLSGQASMGEQKCLVLSTPPTANVGWYAKACSSSRWNTVHFSGLDSRRVSRAYIKEIIDTFGEDSNEYKAYVLGEIPGGMTGQLILEAWFLAAQLRGPVVDGRRPVITCDVARGGEDLAVIGCIEDSKFGLVKFDSERVDSRWGWWSTCSVTTLIEYVAEAIRMKRAGAVCIDDTGLGGGLTDGVRDLQAKGQIPGDCSIIPINFGAQARRPDRFLMRKDEMWWETREILRADEKRMPLISMPTDQEMRAWKLPRTSDLKSQLIQTIYEATLREQIRVHDKRVDGREITKALPTKSPDVAHSLILGAAHYLRQEALAIPVEGATTGEEALRRMMKQNLERISRKPVENPFRRGR